MNIDQLSSFFGWMTVINIGILVFTSVLAMAMRGTICRMHGKLFGLSEKEVSVALYAYLGIYKIFVIVLNIVPFLALQTLR